MSNPFAKLRPLGFIQWFYERVRYRLYGTSPLAELMEKHLPPNPVIVEAGAHAGADTIAFSTRWPQGQIHAFEPVPSLFDALHKRVAGCKNVMCHSSALADKSGTVTMHLTEKSTDASSSVLPPKRHLDYHPEVGFEGQIEVPAITVDDWMAENGIARLDALWLDLQGFELPVMQASPRAISQVQVIVTEFSDVELYEGQARFSAIYEWLTGNGFTCIYRERLWLYGGNALFLRQPA